MSPATSTTQRLHSSLSEDPDLQDIVELFVAEMPNRIATLLGRLENGDWRELQRAAHQLKGAAGSYGFAQITPAAARVEESVQQARPEDEIRRTVEELVALCRQVRGGAPQGNRPARA